MAHPRSRDSETVFVVRVLLVGTVFGLLPCLLIAGVAKLVAPAFDAGYVAWTVGWPVGFVATLMVAFIHRRGAARRY